MKKLIIIIRDFIGDLVFKSCQKGLLNRIGNLMQKNLI